MFNIQPGNQYQLHSMAFIRRNALKDISGSCQTWDINNYIGTLGAATPDGIVTIKEFRNDKWYITTNVDGFGCLYIHEWMIKKFINK